MGDDGHDDDGEQQYSRLEDDGNDGNHGDQTAHDQDGENNDNSFSSHEVSMRSRSALSPSALALQTATLVDPATLPMRLRRFIMAACIAFIMFLAIFAVFSATGPVDCTSMLCPCTIKQQWVSLTKLAAFYTWTDVMVAQVLVKVNRDSDKHPVTMFVLTVFAGSFCMFLEPFILGAHTSSMTITLIFGAPARLVMWMITLFIWRGVLGLKRGLFFVMWTVALLIFLSFYSIALPAILRISYHTRVFTLLFFPVFSWVLEFFFQGLAVQMLKRNYVDTRAWDVDAITTILFFPLSVLEGLRLGTLMNINPDSVTFAAGLLVGMLTELLGRNMIHHRIKYVLRTVRLTQDDDNNNNRSDGNNNFSINGNSNFSINGNNNSFSINGNNNKDVLQTEFNHSSSSSSYNGEIVDDDIMLLNGEKNKQQKSSGKRKRRVRWKWDAFYQLKPRQPFDRLYMGARQITPYLAIILASFIAVFRYYPDRSGATDCAGHAAPIFRQHWYTYAAVLLANIVTDVLAVLIDRRYGFEQTLFCMLPNIHENLIVCLGAVPLTLTGLSSAAVLLD